MMQENSGRADRTDRTADALNLYVDLFNASENEVEQFGVGVRIDSSDG